MFFNLIKNTYGGVLKHWIYKTTEQGLFAVLIKNSKLLFMCSVALYVVSNIILLFTLSILETLNNAEPFILSAFVSPVNAIFIVFALEITKTVSFVNGGVMIARLSKLNKISLVFPLPLFTLLSSPHPANSPMIISTANIASITATNLLFKLSGSNPITFLIVNCLRAVQQPYSVFWRKVIIFQIFQASRKPTICMIPFGMIASRFEARIQKFYGSLVSCITKIREFIGFVNNAPSNSLKSV